MKQLFFASNSQTRANKVFFDLGAHVGESVIEFHKWKGSNSRFYDVISFEPNIEFIPDWIRNVMPLQNEFNSINLIPNIVGCHPSEQVAAFDGWQLAKFGGERWRDRMVPTFDFPKWLSDLAGQYDEIILKMDIEGAEYQLINRLAEENLLKHVSMLLMEIHDHKRGFNNKDTDLLISKIYSHGVTPYLWEAGEEHAYNIKTEIARIVTHGSKEMSAVDFRGLHKIVVEKPPTNHN